MNTTEHTIDAKGKALGRVASEAAKLLLAKHMTTVKKNAVADVKVRVVNASGLVIADTKMIQKTYHSHSGYPGSDRALKLKDLITKKGHSEAITRAVKGMLPGNTLRDKRMKNLTVEE
jgi:large subunit ribosomal protein L13